MMKKVSYLLVLLLFVAGAVNGQKLVADVSKSTLKWNAAKVSGEHHGFVKLKSGELTLEKGKIASGQFVVDMPTLDNEDLTGTWHDKLVGHLKSDDFFSVEKYPEALLKIKSSTPFKNGTSTVTADLTIKGITNPVEFEVSQTDNSYSAKVTVDRTKYGIQYGSGKFFEGLGDKMIYDDFTLEVNVLTK